jgi:hypothetical protein
LGPEKYVDSGRPTSPQADFAAQSVHALLAGELAHELGRARVLPHDRVVQGAPGAALPQHGRLALVGDAEGGDLLGRDARVSECCVDHLARSLPDLRGVVLDPPGPRVDLRVLAPGHRDDLARAVEHDQPRARRALVERCEVVGHAGTL